MYTSLVCSVFAVAEVTKQPPICLSVFSGFGIGVVLGAAIAVIGFCVLRRSGHGNLPALAPKTAPGAILVLSGVTEQSLMQNILLGRFNNDYDKMNSFLEGVIASSQGDCCAAAHIGDDFDRRKMRTSEMLNAGAKVQEVRYCGLMNAKTGEVLLKAYVK